MEPIRKNKGDDRDQKRHNVKFFSIILSDEL